MHTFSEKRSNPVLGSVLVLVGRRLALSASLLRMAYVKVIWIGTYTTLRVLWRQADYMCLANEFPVRLIITISSLC